jgi:hypothetical protein
MTDITEQVKKQLKQDSLGRMLAPMTLLVEYDDNPREPGEFEISNSKFRDLVTSIDKNGVREPIFVYPVADGDAVPFRLKMKNGHRRKRAVEFINQRREEMLKVRLSRGQISEGEVPSDLTPISEIPIVLEEVPADDFELMADMWLSEAQRSQWPIARLVPFFRDTWEKAPPEIKDDAKALAGRIGLSDARVKLMLAIVENPCLYAAATDPSESLLPVKGREKTMRSVDRAAVVLIKHRPDVVQEATSQPMLNDIAREEIRKLLLAKASQMALIQKVPAGVTLERYAPKLKDKDAVSNDDLVEWLTRDDAIILNELIPATVTSSERAVSSLSDLAAAVKRRKVSEMDLADLEAWEAELKAAAEALDEALTSAKRAIRALP